LPHTPQLLVVLSGVHALLQHPSPAAQHVSAQAGLPAGQTHCPLPLSHVFITVAHEVQALAVPHWSSLCSAKGTQRSPLQHPVEHELGVQTHDAPLHVWPVLHAWHVAPPLPHAVGLGEVH
jgi:hypothetical protein